MKGIQIGKEETKLSLFTDDMIIYIDNSKGSIKTKKQTTPQSCKIQSQHTNINLLFIY